MKTTPEQFLKKLDLDDREISLYLYCLKNGPQLVSRLAQIIGTTRTGAYDTVSKLQAKGLCYTTGSHYGRKIASSNPKDIERLLQLKSREIDTLSKDLQVIIPMFENNQNNYGPKNIQTSYFEGVQGLQKLIWQSLQNNNDNNIFHTGSEIDLIETLGEQFMIDYHTSRVHKKIFLQSIRPGDKRGQDDIFHQDKKQYREIRVRPEGKLKLKSNMIIWDNYVAVYFLTNNNISGTLFWNHDFSVMMKSWFGVVWNISKKN